MAKRLACSDSSEAAKLLIKENDWNNLVVLQGENGVTIYTSDEQVISSPCTLASLVGQLELSMLVQYCGCGSKSWT